LCKGLSIVFIIRPNLMNLTGILSTYYIACSLTVELVSLVTFQRTSL
jgi:hypothetical protein